MNHNEKLDSILSSSDRPLIDYSNNEAALKSEVGSLAYDRIKIPPNI
jgi:hypothetical protein